LLNFVLPQITCLVGTQNYGRFVISPLENGYGTTLGNALRRVLLSSLDGVAVTSLRVSDVPHEFSTIPGVREDMMLFILNVKQIRFVAPGYGNGPAAGPTGYVRPTEYVGPGAMGAVVDAFSLADESVSHGYRPTERAASGSVRSGGASPWGDSLSAAAHTAPTHAGSTYNATTGLGPMRLRLSVRGQGIVTAGDILCPPEIEIVNPELYLFTVDDPDAELDIEMTVERGRGYSPSEERGKLPIGELPVDAIFSPIRKANYDVTPARVGQMTNYDTLTLEIWTDGTLRPQKALAIATELLIRHLALFAGVESLEAPAAPDGAAIGTMQTIGAVPAAGLRPDTERVGAQALPGTVSASQASRAYDVPIEELDLTVRVYNCLKRTGITKVGEVLAKMEKGTDEMLAIRNFGIKSLVELRGRLVEKGYLTDEDLPDLGVESDDD
jgi:DNA-directed RNA polymerase alpha subunit